MFNRVAKVTKKVDTADISRQEYPGISTLFL